MKVFVLAPDTNMLVKLRGDLLKDIIARGHEVTAIAGDRIYEDNLNEIGVNLIDIKIDRASTNPFEDIKLYNIYKKLLKENKPDIVFSYSIKPVIYGSLAAASVGVNGIYSLIPGTGYVFSNKGIKAKLIKMYVSFMYKKALKCCTKVFFQNFDDMNDFINMKFISKEKCVKVNGSGVNLEKFTPVELPDEMTFLMTCRLLHDKGVMEYCKAAEIVKRKYPNVKFGLLGPYDNHPNAVKPSELQPYIEKGIIEYYGSTDDVRPYLAKASVFVLPTYYNEGIPRTILEAMAMGRPVITTNWRGCREAVEDGVNGFLVPIKDVVSIVEKIEWFLSQKEELIKMSNVNRRMCLEKFDKDLVNHKILFEMNI